MSDEFKIRLRIAGKAYSLHCKRGREEEILRKASRNIEDRSNKWEAKYPTASLVKEDLLAMSALEISVENVISARNEDITPLFERIGKLNEDLREYLEAT